MTDTETAAPSSLEDLRVGMRLEGSIREITTHGAVVDIGLDRMALLPISQLGVAQVRRVEDVVNIGDQKDVFVLRVDRERKVVALSLEKPPAITWDQMREGMSVTGTVVRVESFGAFVDIGAERPGMVHVSELADDFVQSPSDIVKVGDEVEARIIKINRKKRQIDLSMKTSADMYVEEPDSEDDYVPTAMELALRRAMEDRSDEEEQPVRNNNQQGGGKRPQQDLDDILSRTLKEHQS